MGTLKDMGQGGYRLAFAVAAVIAAAAFSGPAAAAPDCSARLLADWEDGRIDQTYPVQCYRGALASLPEDLKVYSTAESDLTRALQTQLEAPRQVKATDTGGDSSGVSPMLIVIVTAGLLLAGGSVAVITR